MTLPTTEQLRNARRKREQDEAWTHFFGVSFGIVLEGFLIPTIALPFMFWDAFVLSRIWNWFLSPLGLPPIRLLQAMAVNLVIRFVLPAPPLEDLMNEDQKAGRLKSLIIRHLFGPAITLLIGWVLHHWV